MAQHVFKNQNTGDVHVTSEQYTITRLSNLENWDELEGKAKDKALEELGAEAEPVVFSEIGEVSEQYEQHGAGTKYDPDALNEDKLSHAADSKSEGQDAKDVGELNVRQLRAFAAENNIDLGGARTKQEITDLIQASGNTVPADETPENTPAS